MKVCVCMYVLDFVQHNKQHHSKVLLSSFHLNGNALGFNHTLTSKNHLVQHNKQHHRKVLLANFHLNGHTLGFHLSTRKLEQH